MRVLWIRISNTCTVFIMLKFVLFLTFRPRLNLREDGDMDRGDGRLHPPQAGRESHQRAEPGRRLHLRQPTPRGPAAHPPAACRRCRPRHLLLPQPVHCAPGRVGNKKTHPKKTT